jgi:hypothetical protein
MTRFGVQVSEVCTPVDIAESFAVYCKWRQTKRKKIEWEEMSFLVFEQAYRLRTNRIAFLARHAGAPIAVLSLRFYQGGLIEASGIHSVDEYLHLYPNELLHWRAIEWACEKGFRRYSFGAAHTFLRRFGGEVTPIYRHRLDRTWLRRHDMREKFADWGRWCLKRMPKRIEQKTRRILGKPQN